MQRVTLHTPIARAISAWVRPSAFLTDLKLFDISVLMLTTLPQPRSEVKDRRQNPGDTYPIDFIAKKKIKKKCKKSLTWIKF